MCKKLCQKDRMKNFVSHGFFVQGFAFSVTVHVVFFQGCFHGPLQGSQFQFIIRALAYDIMQTLYIVCSIRVYLLFTLAKWPKCQSSLEQ